MISKMSAGAPVGLDALPNGGEDRRGRHAVPGGFQPYVILIQYDIIWYMLMIMYIYLFIMCVYDIHIFVICICYIYDIVYIYLHGIDRY